MGTNKREHRVYRPVLRQKKNLDTRRPIVAGVLDGVTVRVFRTIARETTRAKGRQHESSAFATRGT